MLINDFNKYDMTNLIQLTDKHYLVKVPNNTDREKIGVFCKDEDVNFQLCKLMNKPFINFNYHRGVIYNVELPCNCSILFLANTATEEDWKLIIHNDFWDGFYNYLDHNKTGLLNTATESGHSLLKSKGIYLVNPMGEQPKPIDFVFKSGEKVYDSGMYNKALIEWQSFEDKTGNYIILEEI